MKPKYKDFPWDDVTKQAKELARQGVLVFQKFTCAGCGQRLTIDVPNEFHRTGACDKCDHITNIEKQGCSYTIISGMTPEQFNNMMRKS